MFVEKIFTLLSIIESFFICKMYGFFNVKFLRGGILKLNSRTRIGEKTFIVGRFRC